MKVQADRVQEEKSQSSSDGKFQSQSSGKSTFQFVDSRPEAIAQRKLQDIANNSPHAIQLRAFRDMANNSPQANKIAQFQAMADNHTAAQQHPIQKKENNTGLPDNLKTGVERLSWISLDDVKVHRNSDKPAQLQAHAYAQGTDIHLGAGQEKHLPHEAWHVVQQKQGRVKPTMQMKGGVSVNDETGLEKETDVLGQKANHLGMSNEATPKTGILQAKGFKAEIVQLVEETGQVNQIPTTQKVIQKLDTFKTSDAQTPESKNFPVDKAVAKAEIKQDSVDNPTKHPMYSTFQERIKSVFSKYPPPDGFDVNAQTESIWTQICSGIKDTNAKFDRTAGNDTYSDVAKGYVKMDSPKYLDTLKEFDSVMKTLKDVSNSQFVKAKSFGFYSKPEGRDFAEKNTDLTLDTSGIGSLFDGMPSLNAHQNDWDVQLWGALSQAFGEAVALEMKKGKEVHVCTGGGTNKTGVFAMIEAEALKKGAFEMAMALEDAVTFHAVAAKDQKNRKLDETVKGGDIPGTWYSGHSWDESLSIGTDKFNKLKIDALAP
jgi:hypothetical protein